MERAANRFEVVPREEYGRFAPSCAEHHGDRILQRFERDTIPRIGCRPIAEIKALEPLAEVRRIENRGHSKQRTGRLPTADRFPLCPRNRESGTETRPARHPAPVKAEIFAAVIDPTKGAKLPRRLDGYRGTPLTPCALRLAPLVFERPGELRKAIWADTDPDAAEWPYQSGRSERGVRNGFSSRRPDGASRSPKAKSPAWCGALCAFLAR